MATTLQVGFDNLPDTTFNGKFLRYSDASSGLLYVQKIGTGTWHLTGTTGSEVPALGTIAANQGFSVNQGTASYDEGGMGSFLNYTVNTGGRLVLDNSSMNVNNRLGYTGGASTTGATANSRRPCGMYGRDTCTFGRTSLSSGAGISRRKREGTPYMSMPWMRRVSA